MNYIRKILNRTRKYWFKPIPIFVLHQVGEQFNPLIDRESDWTSLEMFERNIDVLLKLYTFVSLEEANKMLHKRRFRFKHYAALTFDDGYLSILNTLDSLKKRNIPFTLFINSAYWDKRMFSTVNAETFIKNNLNNVNKSMYDSLLNSFDVLKDVRTKEEYMSNYKYIVQNLDISEISDNLYLSYEQIFSLDDPLISIGLHGYEHLNSEYLCEDQFEMNVFENLKDIKSHPRFVPFFAFTWGIASKFQIDKLIDWNLVPVLCDGNLNFGGKKALSRVCIDGIDIRSIRKINYKY